jgi:type II secretory pathway component PulM
LAKILSLRPVSYNWINPAYGSGRQTGFIAQEVQKVFPEFVAADKTGQLSLNYSAMVSPVVKSIQEQQEQIDLLKKQNAELQQRLDKLEQLLKKVAGKNK